MERKYAYCHDEKSMCGKRLGTSVFCTAVILGSHSGLSSCVLVAGVFLFGKCSVICETSNLAKFDFVVFDFKQSNLIRFSTLIHCSLVSETAKNDISNSCFYCNI